MYRVFIRQSWTGTETLINTDVGDAPRLLAAQITKAVGSFDTFSLTIDPTNPAYGQLKPFVTFIRVIRTHPESVLFEGRITTVQPSMGTDGMVQMVATAEGLEGFLHDSVQPWGEFHNLTPKAFLQVLIDQHNKQVEPYKQIKLGDVTVTNSTDNVYRFTDDTKDTYDTIQEKLVTRLGGELQLRRGGDGLYLDYLPKVGSDANQVVQLQTNLLSLSSKVDPTDVISVLKPLGATAQQTTTSSTDTSAATSTPHLTIESVNSGSPYLVDEDLVAEFGVQVGVNTWDDVTLASNLLASGKQWLAEQRAAIETTEISAVDLALVGQSVDEFVCGNTYRVVCDVLGFDKSLRFSGMVIDIVEPLSSTITAGDLALSAEAYSLDLYQAAESFKELQANLGNIYHAANRANNAANQLFASMASVSLTASKSGDKQITYSATLSGDSSGVVQVEVSSDGGKTWSTASGSPLTVTAYGTYELRAKGVYGNYSTKYSGTVSVQLAAPASTGIGDANGAIIDVSEFQGSINWSSVVAGGLSLAVIRVQSGTSHEDLTYRTNIPTAISAGANYAVYAYFAAVSASDAKTEADSFVSRAKAAIGSSRPPRFYMVDVEESSVTSGTMRDAVSAYMDELNKLGIPDSQIVLYIANHLYAGFNLDVGRAAAIWLPSYGANDGTVANSTKPTHPYDLWQYTSVGRVNGISGNVDMSTDPSARMKTLINNK